MLGVYKGSSLKNRNRHVSVSKYLALLVFCFKSVETREKIGCGGRI